MTLTLATFQFKDNKQNEYKVHYYPIGRCEYKVVVTENGIARTEKVSKGRQVISAFHAKESVKEFKNINDEKETTE